MDKYTNKDHCFVLCAYKENPYLEECIKSLVNQTVKSNILIETSTPNNYIESLANKYNIKIMINTGKNGCAQDWNYGFNNANFKLITIAHQDDIYYENYVENVIKYANLANNPLLIYTDYEEIRNNNITHSNTLLKIKRVLNHSMKNRKNWGKDNKKRGVLKFGDAISCPTITIVKKDNLTNPYDESFQCSVDYKTWLNMSKQPGDFVYIPIPLMAHRIYEESHTTIYLNNNTRQVEDKQIINSLWSKPWSNIIYHFYAKSQESNKVK